MVVTEAVASVGHNEVKLLGTGDVGLDDRLLATCLATDEAAIACLLAGVYLDSHIATTPLVGGLDADGGVFVEHHELYR